MLSALAEEDQRAMISVASESCFHQHRWLPHTKKLGLSIPAGENLLSQGLTSRCFSNQIPHTDRSCGNVLREIASNHAPGCVADLPHQIPAN